MVKCKNCGFLSMRATNGEFEEANSDYRGITHSDDNPQAGCASLCFVMAFDLRDEFEQEFKAQRTIYPNVLKVLNRDRDCRRFTPWQQGFTPKEHKEMLAIQEERSWRTEQERKDREYRDEQRRKDEEFRSQQSRDDAAWRRKQERHFLIEIFVGALATAVLVCGTQLFCTWWQVGAAHQSQSKSAQPVPPVPPMPRASE